MRLLLGIQFEIRPDTKVDPAQLRADLKERVKAWITKWYAQWKSQALGFPEDGRKLEPLKDHFLHPTSSSSPSGEAVWGVTWTYPSDVDPSQQWEVKAAVATAGGKTEFSLTVSLTSTEFRVSPLRFEFGPPKIVADIVDTYPCYSGSVRLTTNALTVASPDVPSLVTGVLLDSARPVPVIVISTEGYDAPPGSRVDPNAIARRVAGLAIVTLLSDKYASWSLTDSLSKELSCYLGAIRVYWPGLTKTSKPLEQPLYLPLTIARIQDEGTPFHDLLFQRLANTASARYVEGPVFRAVREAIRRDQDIRRSQLLDELRGSKASAAERSQHVTELQEVIRQRDEEIAYLRDENASLQRNWLDYSRSVAKSESSDSTPVPVEDSAISSVSEALIRGEREFAERLVIWRTARESASVSRSRLGSRVYEALSAMSDVADQSFLAKAEKRSMGMDLGKAFRMRGFDYSARESETAMGGKLGAQRKFRNGPAEEMTMERHLTIGGGDTENCVRIHFEIDDANSKFIVGWCGRHPDVPSTRT